MKTKYWILLLGALLVGCIGLSAVFFSGSEEATFARITSEGNHIKTVNLGIDQEFAVITEDGGRNVVTVKDGKIGVTEADCPDHYCMDRGMISKGTQIVCLPNRLVITLTNQTEIDGVAG